MVRPSDRIEAVVVNQNTLRSLLHHYGDRLDIGTLGLASRVMRTHNQRWICSSAMVWHFFNVSCETQNRENKVRECLKRLAALRGEGVAPISPGTMAPVL